MVSVKNGLDTERVSCRAGTTVSVSTEVSSRGQGPQPGIFRTSVAKWLWMFSLVTCLMDNYTKSGCEHSHKFQAVYHIRNQLPQTILCRKS